MTPEEMAMHLAEVEQRSKSNSHRIDGLERDHAALNRLATAVEVMATKQENLGSSVDKLTEKVEALEAEPGKRWRTIVDKLIWAALAALLGFVAAHLGIT